VCEKLGIGDCFATSEVFLKDFLGNYKGKDEKVTQFLRLAIAAVPYAAPKHREHPDYQVFKRFVLDSVLEKKTTFSGSELNLGSPKQLQVLLYGMLDLPIKHRSDHLTATQEKLGLTVREPKTDKDAMRIAIVEDTVEGDWKRVALNKILGISAETTRVQNVYSKYPLWIHPKTGLVHPQLNGCATTTRRPTSKNFNKLQLPKRGDGKKIRNCVIPNIKAKHDLIVSIDFSQQELRVGAGLSRDEAMLDCFIGYDVEQAITPYIRGLLGEELYSHLIVTKTKDMHTTTAMGILNRRHDYEKELSYEDVVKGIKSGDYLMASTRVAAKEINFAGAYEVGAYKMSVKLLIPKDEARGLLDSRAKTYYVYEIWRKEAKEFVREFGYAVNLFGSRKHSYSDITHHDEYIRGKCERSQVNSQIQSLCADIMHKVGREVRDSRILQTTGAHWINKPYDELVFSMNSQWAVDLVMTVHQIMTQDVIGLCVPMLAEPSLGINWGKQIEIGAFPNPDLIMKAVAEAMGVC
jgi:DNA polymerase I-like protein with 3'-5' exonuclease and polymerase domains